MKPYPILLILLVMLAACQNKPVERPVWLNPSATLVVPGKALPFSSKQGVWQATLLSFAQPLPLVVQAREGGFTVNLTSAVGIIEGPAQLYLSSKDEHIVYAVNLRNKAQSVVTAIDYRSPKTVNPDSSLAQQRTRHGIDLYRNLCPIGQKPLYFQEDELTLSPRAGTFRAIPDKEISSFYVQPGSCTQLPIQATYQPKTNSYRVLAGPLTDRYNNTVADGTQVEFVYTDGVYTHTMEAALLHGVAMVNIPADSPARYRLSASIHTTVSRTIDLVHHR